MNGPPTSNEEAIAAAKARYDAKQGVSSSPTSAALPLPVTKMAGSSHLAVTMAGICTAGGVISYLMVRKPAVLLPSFCMAGLFGTSAYLINHGDTARGFQVASAASLGITAMVGMNIAKISQMGIRIPKPAVVALLLTAGSALYHVNKAVEFSA